MPGTDCTTGSFCEYHVHPSDLIAQWHGKPKNMGSIPSLVTCVYTNVQTFRLLHSVTLN